MKAIQVLRAILRLLYFFAILKIVFLPIEFLLTVNNIEIYELSGFLISNHHWSFYPVLLLFYVGLVFFVIMLYHLKIAAFTITPKHLFNLQTGESLKKAGWFCITGVVLTNIPVWAYHIYSLTLKIKFFDHRVIRVGSGFEATLVVVSFGLFLIILSKLASEGVKLKQENDLTI
ncbi:hypothetical protein AAT17_06960 [Nonlabens sp. MIC269]|uniref:DUF2975 domain-containing protein n=1 Tax=Nonlabens sp. MIC269 TaxID=1476901 RepID=UPI000722F004|nr:DUF2975 domain-containing protein [Nonlabens sp. MIC269]ALM20977.1 hypothetical protein AAT17_06960 [Nonlabens sp. MIC269]